MHGKAISGPTAGCSRTSLICWSSMSSIGLACAVWSTPQHLSKQIGPSPSGLTSPAAADSGGRGVAGAGVAHRAERGHFAHQQERPLPAEWGGRGGSPAGWAPRHAAIPADPDSRGPHTHQVCRALSWLGRGSICVHQELQTCGPGMQVGLSGVCALTKLTWRGCGCSTSSWKHRGPARQWGARAGRSMRGRQAAPTVWHSAAVTCPWMLGGSAVCIKLAAGLWCLLVQARTC